MKFNIFKSLIFRFKCVSQCVFVKDRTTVSQPVCLYMLYLLITCLHFSNGLIFAFECIRSICVCLCFRLNFFILRYTHPHNQISCQQFNRHSFHSFHGQFCFKKHFLNFLGFNVISLEHYK